MSALRSARCCTVAVVAGVLVLGRTAAAQMQGEYRTKLTRPVSKELTDQARQAAKTQLRIPLLEWINEHSDIPWDTANAIYRYHLSGLVDDCAEQAVTHSEFKDYLWTYALTVSDEARHAAVVRHNARQDSLALKFWVIANHLAADRAYAGVFRSGVAAVFHAMGHIGTPLTVAGDSVQSHVRDRARALVRSALSRTTAQSAEMVIEGKPGYKPTKAPTVLVSIDSTPLPNFPLNAILPLGKKIAAGQSDGQGRFSLGDITIPYVANGTFLFVRPSFDGLASVPVPFEAKDLGLNLSGSQQPTFIFKVTPPRYSLRYTVNAVSQVDVPKDFSGTQFLERFLRDSCYLVPQQGSEPADLRLEILAQVSKYTNDKTYTMNMKVEARLIIEPLRGQGKLLDRQVQVHERSYDMEKDVSTGLFFWETAGKLTGAVKSLLNEL